MESESSGFDAYLVGQLLVAAVGALMLLVADFGGYYYRSGGVDVYGYVYLGSGVLSTALILVGAGGLAVAAHAAYRSLRGADGSEATVVANARRSVRAAGFTAGLALAGAVALVLSNLGNEWWLDAGFYGAFFGGLLVVLLGELLLRAAGEDGVVP